MRQQLEDDARMDKETVAKAPEKFKTASSWKVFSEVLETYLGQILGSGRIPEAVYLTEQEQSIELAPLHGIAYQRDNIKYIKEISGTKPQDKSEQGSVAMLSIDTRTYGTVTGTLSGEESIETRTYCTERSLMECSSIVTKIYCMDSEWR
jgi:hypothetical protein